MDYFTTRLAFLWGLEEEEEESCIEDANDADVDLDVDKDDCEYSD